MQISIDMYLHKCVCGGGQEFNLENLIIALENVNRHNF